MTKFDTNGEKLYTKWYGGQGVTLSGNAYCKKGCEDKSKKEQNKQAKK